MANRPFFSRLRPAPSLLGLCLVTSAGLGLASALGGCDESDTTASPATGADAASGTDATASSDAATATDTGGGVDASNVDSSTGSDAAADADAATDDATTDAASDAGSDAAISDSGDAVDGGPYGLVYSGKFNGIDLRTVTASLTGDGKMIGYVFNPASEAPFVITAKVDDLFSDSFVSAGKWTDGTVGGKFYDDGGVKTLSANEAFHYGLALVPTPPPASGTANYTLLAATKPQLDDGSQAAGTVTAASLSVSFNGTTSANIGYSITMTLPDGTYDVTGGGGPGSPGDAGAGFNLADAGYRFYTPSLAALGDGGVCTSACSGNGYIVFSGANAERAIVAYAFGGAKSRRGVVVLQKQ